MAYWVLDERRNISHIRTQIWTSQMAQVSDKAMYHHQMSKLKEAEDRLNA